MIEIKIPGRLVFISSVSSIFGGELQIHYTATKGAMNQMMKSIAIAVGKYGITANAVLPGWIATEMTEWLQNWDAFNDKAIGSVPMRRWGEGKDFAGMAVYFASDASKFHTGDSVVIDGGYSIF